MNNRSDLRHDLSAAISQRNATLWTQRDKVKDYDALKAAMGRAIVFLNSYPQASDERVRQWCEAHREDVARIVPGNSPNILKRLIG